MYLGKTKRYIYRIMAAGLCFIFAFSYLLPKEALAGRSNAGGGEVAEMDWGNVATNIGIGLGSMVVGNLVSTGLTNTYGQMAGTSTTSTWNAMGQSLSTSLNLNNLAMGYNTYVATSQVGRAVGMAGSYYDWDPQVTFVASSLATGATSGFLNPDVALNRPFADTMPSLAYSEVSLVHPITLSLGTMGKGALVGGLSGLGSSLAMVAVDGDKIKESKSPGVLGQLAGLVGGTMATNLGRGIVNPDNQVKASWERQREKYELEFEIEDYKPKFELPELLETTTDIDDIGIEDYSQGLKLEDEIIGALKPKLKISTEPVFKEITGYSKDGKTIKYGRELSPVEFQKETQNYRIDALGDIFVVTDTHAKANLWKATFVDTFDQWPTFVSKGLGLWAEESLGKDKKYLGPLVSSITESASASLFQNLSDVYGLRPSLYWGREGDVIAGRITYVNSLKQIATLSRLAEFNKEAAKLEEDYRADPKTLENKLNELGRNMGILSKDGQFDFAEGINFGELKGLSKVEIENKLLVQQEKNRTAQGITLTANQREGLYSDARVMAEKIYSREISESKYLRNQAMSQAKLGLQVQMKWGVPLPEALKVAHTSESALFAKQVGKGLRFGILESAIGGGIQAIMRKNMMEQDEDGNWEYKNPQDAVLVSFAGNLVTATARGIARYEGWQESGDYWTLSHWDIVKPEIYEHKPGDEEFDYLAYKLSQSSYDYEMYKYDRFRTLTNLEPTPTEGRMVWDYAQEKYVPEDRMVVTIRFPDERPALSHSIAASIAQATTESFVKTFSFGYPLTGYGHDFNVPALTFVNYIQSLRATSPSFSTALANSLISANLDATGNNISGVISQAPPLADFFQVRRERFVKTTAPLMPYTMQNLQFIGGLASTNIEFFAPFLDPRYGTRLQEGDGDYLKK